MVSIYALLDPITKEIRYIGKTKVSLSTRLRQHLSRASLLPKTHKSSWIKSLLNSNLTPEIQLITTCTEEEWEQTEQYYITQYHNLTNGTIGGDGIKYFSKEIRDKISLANSKVIYQYGLDGKYINCYQSASEAAKKLNVGPGIIIAAANVNSRKNSAAGYQWSRVYKSKLSTHYPKNKTPIMVTDSNGRVTEHGSVIDAAKFMSVNKATLSFWLQEGRSTCIGFSFCKVNPNP